VAAPRYEDAAIHRLFATAERADDRPSTEELITYGTLAASRRWVVEGCTQRDPEIQAEMRLLRRLGRNPLVPNS
jgi:hypothetical protein